MIRRVSFTWYAPEGRLGVRRLDAAFFSVNKSHDHAIKAMSSRRTPGASPLIIKRVAVIEFPGCSQYIDSPFRLLPNLSCPTSIYILQYQNDSKLPA
jgi:hypothetical protein